MTKTKSLLILIFTLLFSNYYLSSFPEEISITTYYPSPVGIYKELRAKRMAIGDSFYNSSHYCWEGSCTVSVDSDADLVVEGKVGIGTTDPEKELHVAGDAEIEGGVVIGNPTGGNKGTGTINAKKIYVNGSEVEGKCISLLRACSFDDGDSGCHCHGNPPCTVPTASCPTGYPNQEYVDTFSVETGAASDTPYTCCYRRTIFKITTCCK